MKDSIGDLKKFQVSPASESPSGTPVEGVSEASATLALEGQIKRMQDELDTLARGVRALPHANILSGHLANLKGQIEQLQGYQYVDDDHLAAGEADTTEVMGASQPRQTVGSTGGSAQAAANERAGLGSAANPPKEAEPADAEAEKMGETGRALAADHAITAIEGNTNNMERDLRAAFPHFSLFAAVSQQVQAMRDQARTFADMTGADYRAVPEVLLDREAAEKRFDQARDNLGAAIGKVEAAIQGRTRVIALANVIRRNPDLSEAGASAMARTILHDFDSLERFLPIVMPLQLVALPDSSLARIGIAPKRLATLSTDSIQTIYIFMIGAIGSLLFITRYHLELAIHGRGLGSAPTRPIAWLLFRPFFGIVVAFAVYLLVRAGQFAFGTSPGDGVGVDLNIPILSVVALFAGLLAWQALEAIEARGRQWFSSQTRKPLWASGLDNALRTSGHTIAECAHQIGRSPEQVERWLLFRDRVPVELQDRIRTWLDKSLNELFGENKPAEALDGRPMWAVGLKAALDNRQKRLDEVALLELLHEEKRDDNLQRVRKWINLRLQVSPAMQWQLVGLLQVPHGQLFAPVLQDRDIWALHLRHAIESRGERAQQIADRLGLGVERIHAWKELEAPVPTAMQDRLMLTLDRSFSALFEPEPKDEDWLILANGLGQAIERKYGKRDLEAFAAEIDVDVARVQEWIDRKKPVAKGTRATILRLLGPVPDLFSPPKIGP